MTGFLGKLGLYGDPARRTFDVSSFNTVRDVVLSGLRIRPGGLGLLLSSTLGVKIEGLVGLEDPLLGPSPTISWGVSIVAVGLIVAPGLVGLILVGLTNAEILEVEDTMEDGSMLMKVPVSGSIWPLGVGLLAIRDDEPGELGSAGVPGAEDLKGLCGLSLSGLLVGM